MSTSPELIGSDRTEGPKIPPSGEENFQYSDELRGVMRDVLRLYDSLGDDGVSFLESFTHYADLTAEASKCIDILEEADEYGLPSDSVVVQETTDYLFDVMIKRSNQSNKVRSWFGIADVEEELWQKDSDFDHPESYVDEIDRISDQLSESVEDLPKEYTQEIPDLDEAGFPTVNLEDYFKSLKFS